MEAIKRSPAFQWYAADYLADERVMLLSLESEAAYVRLLNYCWREGSIPANPASCAPMCKYADVKIIKPALGLFIKSPTQPGRLIHKRLEEERAKQEAYRAKQSEKGAKGGRPPKATDKPEETHSKPAALPQLSPGLTVVKPDESSSSSTSSSTSITEIASKQAGPIFESSLLADEAPIFLIKNFSVYVDKIGYPEVDKAMYLLRIQAKAQELKATTETKWKAYIQKWLDNDKKSGQLLRKEGAERTGFGQAPAATTASRSYDRAALAAYNNSITT